MATTAPAEKYLRALRVGVWLSPAIWLAASLACAQAPSLCADEGELLTPSAWCTIDRSKYLRANPSELITPLEWSGDEPISCRTLLEPFDTRVPESELVTPAEWLAP